MNRYSKLYIQKQKEIQSHTLKTSPEDKAPKQAVANVTQFSRPDTKEGYTTFPPVSVTYLSDEYSVYDSRIFTSSVKSKLMFNFNIRKEATSFLNT